MCRAFCIFIIHSSLPVKPFTHPHAFLMAAVLLACSPACIAQHFSDTANRQKEDSLLREYRKQHFEYWSLLLGYHGINYHNFEVGFARNKIRRRDRHAFSSSTYYLSSETALRNNSIIIGPKVGCWFTASDGANFFALGFAGIYYTDFSGGAVRFRPDIGLGMSFFKLSWGYNIPLSNFNFMGANKGVLSLQVCIPVSKQKRL